MSFRRVNPFEIHFSQHSIKASFRDGSSIDDLVEGLKNGNIKSEEVAPIRLVERDGISFTLDNRRLEAFRRAGVEICCRMARPEEVANEVGKFTTRNGGSSVVVR